MSINKGGRPKKNQDEKISQFVKMGFNDSQMDLIKAVAENSGYKHISKFLRDSFVKMIQEKRLTLVMQSEVNQQVASDLHGLANNLNQITKKMHELGLDVTQSDLALQLSKIDPLLKNTLNDLTSRRREVKDDS